MKLSTKSRYGLKVCFELAKRSRDERVALTSLSTVSNTTVSYLEQIMILLKRNNIVCADRGVNGGYYLAREADEISLGEVLRALEDGLKIVDCIDNKCTDKELCPSHVVWEKMYKALNNMLDRYTLKDMIDNSEDK